MKYAIGLFALILQVPAFAQVNTQFLKCVGTFQLEVCELVPLEFIPKSKVELNFSVDYIYNCTGTPLSIGLLDENNKALYKFDRTPVAKNMKFNGRGPIVSGDAFPGVTRTGGQNLACDLRVVSFSTDISDNTRDLMDKSLEVLQAFNLIIRQAKDIDSLASTIQTLLTKIDLASLKTLIVNLYNNTLSLRDSYLAEKNDEVVDALNDVIADLKMKICSNPPLRVGNEQICGANPTDPVSSDPVADLIASVSSIKDASKLTIETIKSEFSSTVVYATGALAVATQVTKNDYMKKICGELDKAQVTDEACKPYKPEVSQ